MLDKSCSKDRAQISSTENSESDFNNKNSMAGNSIYRPLRDNGHEIRVLHLDPSSDSSDNSLKCRLKYILLHDNSAPAVEITCPDKELKNDFENHSYIANGVNEETSEAAPEAQQMNYATKGYKQRKRIYGGKIPCNIIPPYIALSYTWGDLQDTVPLQVDGTTMMVTRNLHDALVAIRSEPQISSFSVWADAVCINQDDVKERNKEVKRMFEVYRKASRVVIWLGYVPTTWNFFGMKTIGDINKIVPRLLMKRNADSEVIHPVECTNDEILTMLAILDRPYWTRIWILQELVMADYENTFFFWAQTLRHISDLQHAQQFFDNAISIWLRSAEISSLLDQVSTYEYTGTRTGHRTPDNGDNPGEIDLEDKETQIARRMLLLTLGKAKFESDISERVIEGIITKKGFDAEVYLQEKFKDKACLSSVETDKMFRSLEELVQLAISVVNDSRRRMKHLEVKLLLNELSTTMATMIQAVTLDETTDDVGFQLLMTHSLNGQCTNERDLVYGLLGLHEHKIASQITPDYDLSINRVLSDFSEAVIRCRGLNFLCQYEEVLSRFSDDLPSWVVNLIKGRDHPPRGGEWATRWKKFSAGGVRTDDIRFSIDNDKLHCQGLLYKVDTKTPQPKYHNKDLIIQALERVVSFYTPDEGQCRSMLNISTQTTSEDSEVANVVEMSQKFWELHSDFTIEGIRLKSLFPEQDDIMKWEFETASEAIKSVSSMQIFTTADGKLGLGTQDLRDGDNIAILRGCNIPTILREHEGGHKLIGMCYLDGVMFGELFEESLTLEELTIL
jgi:hypothetical protein